jgi:hypothetical protein
MRRSGGKEKLSEDAEHLLQRRTRFLEDLRAKQK